MHVSAAPELNWKGKHAKRVKDAIDEHVILAKRIGTPMHDCWAPD